MSSCYSNMSWIVFYSSLHIFLYLMHRRLNYLRFSSFVLPFCCVLGAELESVINCQLEKIK
jgi:hypothetical protein